MKQNAVQGWCDNYNGQEVRQQAQENKINNWHTSILGIRPSPPPLDFIAMTAADK